VNRTACAIAIALGVLVAAPASAGEAEVVAAEAYPEGEGRWRFSATLRHGDEGWDHYADRWDVVAPDGTILGTRVLLHPHVDEQPFTRSLGGVEIPDSIERVTIRANDSRHGPGGAELEVELRK
jgi:hypothetical protein